MPLFSRSSTGSSCTTRASDSRTYNIPTYTTDRSRESYKSDPYDANMPNFTRTSSYYESNLSGDTGHRYLQASDVRRQVRDAPSTKHTYHGYPKYYGNKPPLPLKAESPYREYPVAPSSSAGGSSVSHWRGPGPIRAFYNEKDRSKFDVAYHDLSKPPTGPRGGSGHPRTSFTLSEYRDRPTYTDTSNMRRYG